MQGDLRGHAIYWVSSHFPQVKSLEMHWPYSQSNFQSGIARLSNGSRQGPLRHKTQTQPEIRGVHHQTWNHPHFPPFLSTCCCHWRGIWWDCSETRPQIPDLNSREGTSPKPRRGRLLCSWLSSLPCQAWAWGSGVGRGPTGPLRWPVAAAAACLLPPPAGSPQGTWSNSPTPCHDLLFQADGTVERPLS